MPQDKKNIHTNATEDEIDLLDVLLTVAKNIKLLLFGPLFVGLCVWVVASNLPKHYQSQLALQAGTTVMASTAKDVFTASATIKAAQTLLKDQGFERLASDLRGSVVQVNVARGSTRVSVSVTGKSPKDAQVMAQALLQTVKQASRPQGPDLAKIALNIKNVEASLVIAQSLENRLGQVMQEASDLDPVMVQSYTALLQAISQNSQRLEELVLVVEGLTPDAVLTPPSLPEEPIRPRPVLMGVVAALTTGFALILLVFVRQALSTVASDPERVAKLRRIGQALRGRPLVE